MKLIQIDLKENKRSYPIYIDNGVFSRIASMEDISWEKHSIYILSDKTVGPMYEPELKKQFEAIQANVFSYQVNSGESSKSLEVVGRVIDDMLHNKMDRKSILICLGGGVVGDLGGFIASIFLRGIHFVQIPTTLLGAVDSSVGGKVGVNSKRGKNLIGQFYQPQAVYIDPKLFQSLDKRQIQAGLAEVVKYGMIWDESLFEFLENNIEYLLNQEDILSETIGKCCQIKADVVSKDEKESDLRRILNYGHTVGHSLEKLGEFNDLIHGEAVSIGMVAECHLSELILGIDLGIRKRLTQLLKKIGLPTALPKVNFEKFYQTIQLDKKMDKGNVVFVFPEKIGKVTCCNQVTKDHLRSIMNQ